MPTRRCIGRREALGRDRLEPVAADQPRVGYLEVRDYRQQQERNQFVERPIRVGEGVVEANELGESEISWMASVANQAGGRYPRARTWSGSLRYLEVRVEKFCASGLVRHSPR